MDTRRIDVFFYGLFMDPDLLRSKGLDPINVRRAQVPGLSLRIGQRAALVEDAGGGVHGVVIALTHAEVDRLYAEPSVAMYRPEAVIVHFPDGSQTAALCFNLPGPPAPGEANPEYATRLRDLGRRLGLPEEYVASLQ